MAKYLISGASGFIGSHLLEALKNEDVTVVDNFSTGKRENIDWFKGKVIEANVQDVKINEKFDVIYHLAALARIQPSIEDPLTSHYANTVGTLNMLTHAKKWGAKFVYASSSSIYGAGTLPMKEYETAHPGSPYALQKYTGEEYARIFNELFGLHTVAFRFFNVYGERQLTEGAYATAIGIFLKQKAQGKVFTINGDGEQRRDFTYVKDVVKALVQAPSVATGVYNVGTGRNYSINEITKLIGKSHPFIHLPPKKGEYPATLASTDKFESTFGWKPETKLEDWLCQR